MRLTYARAGVHTIATISLKLPQDNHASPHVPNRSLTTHLTGPRLSKAALRPVSLGSLLVFQHLFMYTKVRIRVEVVVLGCCIFGLRALLIASSSLPHYTAPAKSRQTRTKTSRVASAPPPSTAHAGMLLQGTLSELEGPLLPQAAACNLQSGSNPANSCIAESSAPWHMRDLARPNRTVVYLGSSGARCLDIHSLDLALLRKGSALVWLLQSRSIFARQTPPSASVFFRQSSQSTRATAAQSRHERRQGARWVPAASRGQPALVFDGACPTWRDFRGRRHVLSERGLSLQPFAVAGLFPQPFGRTCLRTLAARSAEALKFGRGEYCWRMRAAIWLAAARAVARRVHVAEHTLRCPRCLHRTS
jgi:hypothetical protein